MLDWLIYLALVLAQAAAATAVTVHVLLTKRDVRAAIGWIGIAWLSPVFGAALYYGMGINRVSRRAARLRHRFGRRLTGRAAPASAPLGTDWPANIGILAKVGEAVTGWPLVPGNAVAALSRGDAAYPAMLEAIGQARHSIALASYIFRADRVGLAFVEALAAARGRGVEVRVLLDGIGCGYLTSPALRALQAAHVPAARFMHFWLPWRMPFLNMRSHKKLLIVDGTVGFTGGMNIGAEYRRAGRPSGRADDVHFRVEGPVVAQLMQSIAEDWSFSTGEMLEQAIWWPDLAPAGPVLCRGIVTGPDEDVGKLETILAAAVGQARHSLRIVTPYFLPDEHLAGAIALAARRGVKVEVLLPRRSDHRLLDWAMRGRLRFMAGVGIRFLRTRPPFDHAKLVTMDGAWCAVGSANWDARSLRLNFEFNLECYDRVLCAELDRLIDAKVARASRISSRTLAARPLVERLRDAGAHLLLPYL